MTALDAKTEEIRRLCDDLTKDIKNRRERMTTPDTKTKEKLALSIRNHLLNPNTSKDLEENIELIYNVGPLKTLVRVKGRYFSVKIQEHGGPV